jgi:SAM-dependent methyltransferase
MAWLGIASLGLLVLGGWHLSLGRMLLVVFVAVPLVVGLALSHFDWHHPFVSRYVGASFYLVAVALLVDSVRFEEWIELLTRRKTSSPWIGDYILEILLGVAVGRLAVFEAIRGQRQARRLARLRHWSTNKFGTVVGDELAIPFRSALEGLNGLERTLRSWDQRRDSVLDQQVSVAEVGRGTPTSLPPTFFCGNSDSVCRLVDVYDFPCFAEFIAAVFDQIPISSEWMHVINRAPRDARVLEIGAGTGRFTAKLLEGGLNVCAVERHESFCCALSTLREKVGAKLEVIRGSFPERTLDKYDMVFLHQNVFLEIANEISVEDAINALNAVRTPHGKIFFDFVDDLSVKSEGMLYDGNVDNIGRVRYGYSEHRLDGQLRRTTLTYELSRREERFYVRTPLSFAVPSVNEIVGLAARHGLTANMTAMGDSFTFFPCKPILVELREG